MAELEPGRVRLTVREGLWQSFVTIFKQADYVVGCGCLMLLLFGCGGWALLRPRPNYDRVAPPASQGGEAERR